MSQDRPPVAPPIVSYAFRPQIALYSSPDVDDLAKANGLPNLAQLLKPWETSVEKVTLRTSTFVSHTLPSLPLLIDDSRDLVHTELDAAFLDSLTTSVERRTKGWLDHMDIIDVGEGGDHDLWKEGTVEELTPWYTFFRDRIASRRPRTEYETFGHPVACLITVSTTNPEPLNAFAALYEATMPEKLFATRPWVDPGVLRYYVLVHDLTTGPVDEWLPLLEDIRRAYGVHCGMLCLNAEAAVVPDSAYVSADQRPPPKSDAFPDYWKSLPSSPVLQSAAGGQMAAIDAALAQDQIVNAADLGKNLGEEDVRRIKHFLREFTVQSLVPWMEKSVSTWNEQLAANRRGIAGRLFSVGRRYFGSRPASPAPGSAQQPAYDPVKGIYPYQSQEAQTRRLADFAFMIGDFKLAAATYEIARKDFANDKAWRYFASATRMAGLSGLLMATLSNNNAFDADAYLEQAAQTTRPDMTQLDDLRAICLYYELYQRIGEWQKASVGLLRAASDIEELSSSLLLEQAAMSVLKSPQPARRRFSLLMTMAMHRYQKTGPKLLARRCGQQALSLYNDQVTIANWQELQSHLDSALGRQAYNTGHTEQAAQHFVKLFGQHAGDDSDETTEDDSFLDDLTLAWEALGDSADEVASTIDLKLPRPIFDTLRTKFMLRSDTTSDQGSTAHTWNRLEQDCLKNGYPFTASDGNLRKAPSSLLPDAFLKVVTVNEHFQISVIARNPSKSTVKITELDLRFESDSQEDIVEVVHGSETVVSLAPQSEQEVSVSVIARKEGTCTLANITYRFNGFFKCTENLARRGPRLYTTKQQLLTPTYAADKSLLVEVRNSIPILEVGACTLPSRILAGEVCSAVFTLRNRGSKGLRNLRVICSHPHFVQSTGEKNADPEQIDKTDGLSIVNRARPNIPWVIDLPGDTLEAGAEIDARVLCRGDQDGSHLLSWLFVYEDNDGDIPPRSRVTKHVQLLEVSPSLSFVPTIRPASLEVVLDVRSDTIQAPIEITQLSTLSPAWKAISSYPEHPSDAGHHLPVILQENQTTAAVLRFEATNAPPIPRELWAYTLAQLDGLLNKKEVSPNHSKALRLEASSLGSSAPDLFSDEHLLYQVLATRSHLRIQSMREQFPSFADDELQDYFPLFSAHTLDLIIFWKIPSLGKSGHHYLADLCFGPPDDVASPLLRLSAEDAGSSTAEGQHERSSLLRAIAASEMTGEGACPVAVAQADEGEEALASRVIGSISSSHLTLRNLTSQAVSITLEFLGPHSESLGRRYPPVHWTGRMLNRRTLDGFKCASITGRHFVQHGTRDLGSWILLVSRGQQQWTILGSERPMVLA